jgi:hypothetical protein
MTESARNSHGADAAIDIEPGGLTRMPWGPLGQGKNDRTCLRCGRNFWAWNTGRARCYLCVPPEPAETRRILADIAATLPGGAAQNGISGGTEVGSSAAALRSVVTQETHGNPGSRFPESRHAEQVGGMLSLPRAGTSWRSLWCRFASEITRRLPGKRAHPEIV